MNAPWLEHYDPGIPRSISPYPEKTLVDVLRERVLDRSSSVVETQLSVFCWG